ncbi:MAG TPA: DegT/DnrJ/EryC1/StrS family aminotransferase [Candidatus Acidoferrales bacterium]|nr:DegT/DnrJ/EryC1/StrS family aminotransferase [Candidatus Acidoferrales bacterium]
MHALIRSSKPVFPQEDIIPILQDIKKVLEDGQFRNGKNVATFEDMVTKYVGVDGAVAFDSDSSAYETALRYFDVASKEVVVCTNSFISVPNSVVAVGGKAVFADIAHDTLSIDPESLKQNISKNTKGVIVTHIAGFPNPHLREIQTICKDHGLFLIEDATHAIGATINGQKVGSFGDAAVYAFTPTKVITTGEGGMLVSNNKELCEFAKRFSFYGSGKGKTNFVDLGRHMVLPEISAVIGIYQLKRLDEFIARRNEISAKYNAELDMHGVFSIVKCPTGFRCSYYKYPLILNSRIDKAAFTKRLSEDFGIETGNVFYPPCHMQGVYQKQGAFTYGTLFVAEQVLAQTITLPMHTGLSDEDVAYVIEKVKS